MRTNGNGNLWWRGIVLVFLLGLIIPGFLGIFRTGRTIEKVERHDTDIADMKVAINKLTDVVSEVKAMKEKIENIEKNVDKMERRGR